MYIAEWWCIHHHSFDVRWEDRTGFETPGKPQVMITGKRDLLKWCNPCLQVSISLMQSVDAFKYTQHSDTLKSDYCSALVVENPPGHQLVSAEVPQPRPWSWFCRPYCPPFLCTWHFLQVLVCHDLSKQEGLQKIDTVRSRTVAHGRWRRQEIESGSCEWWRCLPSSSASFSFSAIWADNSSDSADCTHGHTTGIDT